jgi:hypothetical protein
MKLAMTSAVFFCGLVLCSALLPAFIRADDIALPPERIATERGLQFIQADAVKWRREKNCSTCHHGTMTIWVQSEAKSRGFAVVPEELQENVGWAKERLEKIDLPRDTRPGWSMVNTPALYMAMLANFVPGQDAISPDERKRIAGHLLRHQEENGAWMWSSAPPKNIPPPVFESDEVATRLAYMALAPQAALAADDAPAIQASLARADAWLKDQASDTTQAAVLRLLMNRQANAPAGEIKSGIEGLLSLQNPDGGWSQVKERESDAYATGQVLYALSVAGVLTENEAIKKGVTFLVNTQREDGSWPMKRRGHPGVTPSENVVPITYSGTAWAMLGLMRSTPSQSPPAP